MEVAGNHLMGLLSADDRRRLVSACDRVELVAGTVLREPGAFPGSAWFPLDGFVSIEARSGDDLTLDVGMVGREGMVGLHLVLGSRRAPSRVQVHAAGTALRISAANLDRELVRSPKLRGCIGRYAMVRMTQLGTAAACLNFHAIRPRLARWLLMGDDRSGPGALIVTQAFLANRLGVRRVGITTAALTLQRAGLIDYHRGRLRVLDRAGLHSEACACYDADRRVYCEHLGTR